MIKLAKREDNKCGIDDEVRGMKRSEVCV